MARAKRTDRADARRRYRATQAEVPDAQDDAEGTPADAAPTASSGGAAGQALGRMFGRRSQPAAATPPPAATRSTSAQQSRSAPPVRPSFTASFRAATRPFNIRNDIADIPNLALHTRAVWIPGIAAIGSGAYFLVSTPLGTNVIANLLFQLFVLPPTIAGAFLAGILAPRATYIAGGIAALIGALTFSVAVFITPVDIANGGLATASPSPAPSVSGSTAPGASGDTAASPSGAIVSASPAPTPAPSASAGASPSGSSAPSASQSPAPSASPAPVQPFTDADKFGAALQSLLLSVPFGIAIGAFGGYYRRFLAVSSPARNRREQEQQQQRSKSQRQPPKKRS